MAEDQFAIDVDSDAEFDDVNYKSIDLSLIDDTESKFRTDDDLGPVTKTVRKSGMLVRYGILDRIHGKLSSTAKGFCTILVFDFQFDKIRSTIHSVDIDIIVSDPGREIRVVTPTTRISLNKQNKEVEDTIGLGLHGGGAGGSGDVSAQRKTKKDKVAFATVIGWPDHEPLLRKRAGLSANCARWAIRENEVNEDGVPARMRAAILILREDEAEFDLELRFDINSSEFRRLFGKTPLSMPERINPKLESTKRVIKSYSKTSLASVGRELDKYRKVSYGAFVETFSND